MSDAKMNELSELTRQLIGKMQEMIAENRRMFRGFQCTTYLPHSADGWTSKTIGYHRTGNSQSKPQVEFSNRPS